MTGRRVLLVSAFFETEMPSLRETQYVRALCEGGYDVTILTTTESHVWSHSRSRAPVTRPDARDEAIARRFGVRILRRRPWLRISDFFLAPVPLREVRRADVVHAIEFRQGFTVVAAALARLLGKRVVYEHEQQGEPAFSLLRRLNAAVRRGWIALGSLTPHVVRHTTHASRAHYEQLRLRAVPYELAPLGADEETFRFDPAGRERGRRELGVSDDRRVLLTTGKIDTRKRPLDVARACRETGWTLAVVGHLAPGLEDAVRSILGPDLVVRPHRPAAELNDCSARPMPPSIPR